MNCRVFTRSSPRLVYASVVLAAVIMVLLPGCAMLASSATESMGENLAAALANQDDPEIVRSALPAYLLLFDGLIEGDPDNPALYLSAARMNSAYAGAFVIDPARAMHLHEKALRYARAGWCHLDTRLCSADRLPFDEFRTLVDVWDTDEVDALYIFGVALGGYIESHSDDWDAVAQVPKVRLIMERVVAIDDNHDHGGPHLYLGVIESLTPPSLGGRLELSRAHFELAKYLADNRNHLIEVLYAERYARMTFDRQLHDRLLEEVLSLPPEQPGFTMTNVLAQRRARQLLDSADEYF